MKIYRSLTLAAAGLAAASAMLTGCGASSGGAGGGGGDALTIGFIAAHFDSYFTGVKNGLQDATKADGSKVIAVSSDDDAGKEAQAFQDLISRQVDVIAVSALDPEGSAAGIRSAVQAGIPVVCYNACISDKLQKELISAFIQSDNTSLGSLTGDYAADFIKKNLGGKATIGILNCDTFDVCKLRKAGFKQALDKAGINYKVVADQTEFLADKTPATAEAMLTANPGINVMWSATDGGGTGEVSAIKGAHLTGKVTVFSTDMSLALGQELIDGSILKATTGQDGAGQGSAIYKAAKAAKPGKQLDPYETLIPGILFSGDDPTKVKTWMADNK